MLSLLSLRARIDAGTLTPDASIRLCREAIAAREPEIGALVSLAEDPVVPASGPLAGIPFGVKDVIDTADLPTQMGSTIYEGWRPKADAPAVAQLRALGGVALAKTTTTAFAFMDPTRTRNPNAPGRTPGGSSAGSAAAVAAGMLPLALGTQTGGSVIRPAAFCGVVGVKPSFRLLPTVGMKCFSWSLDTLGLFAEGVADAAHALALLADRPEIERFDGAAPRIGVVVPDFCAAPEPEGAAALQAAARAAEGAGAQVVPMTLPSLYTEAFALHGTIQDFEGIRALAWEYTHRRDALTPMLRAQLDAAGGISAEAYDAARRLVRRARRGFREVLAERGVDVILTPPAPGAAPEGYATTGDSRFNRLWTLLGVPCVTVPVPGNEAPLGVQVVTAFGDDGRALAAARFVERALER
jgi:Asp-tRNA(Asn)/Glu-tRNA(Gln) amidotransferase A subunit family amidase